MCTEDVSPVNDSSQSEETEINTEGGDNQQLPSGTLLIGSSIVRDIKAKKYELTPTPICARW